MACIVSETAVSWYSSSAVIYMSGSVGELSLVIIAIDGEIRHFTLEISKGFMLVSL